MTRKGLRYTQKKNIMISTLNIEFIKKYENFFYNNICSYHLCISVIHDYIGITYVHCNCEIFAACKRKKNGHMVKLILDSARASDAAFLA